MIWAKGGSNRIEGVPSTPIYWKLNKSMFVKHNSFFSQLITLKKMFGQLIGMRSDGFNENFHPKSFCPFFSLLPFLDKHKLNEGKKWSNFKQIYMFSIFDLVKHFEHRINDKTILIVWVKSTKFYNSSQKKRTNKWTFYRSKEMYFA